MGGPEQERNQRLPTSKLQPGPEPGRVAEQRGQIQSIGQAKTDGPEGDSGGSKGLSKV